MILDSSALIAILRNEPDARVFADAISKTAHRRISAINYFEIAAVVDGSGDPIASRRVDELLWEAEVVIEPVTAAQTQYAREAYRDFGKGSHHPAKLNLGDCFAYALAKEKGEKILFKGRNFLHTDLDPVLR